MSLEVMYCDVDDCIAIPKLTCDLFGNKGYMIRISYSELKLSRIRKFESIPACYGEKK